MFAFVALLLCAVDIAATHLMDLSHAEYGVVFQVYIALLCALSVLAKDTQRDKSVLSVLLIWAVFVLATDQFDLDLPNSLLTYESAIFTSFVIWAMIRPYFYPSDEYKPGNVCIAFYKGTNAPFLSSLASLVGLPFASVAIVTGATALRASGSGKMVLSDAKALLGSDFVLIDTGKQGTPSVIQAISECVGKPTRSFGLFRTRCIANLMPVLKVIEYEPTKFLGQSKFTPYKIPSIFYFQCVRKAHG